ncbi:MAG: hypothetical protein OXH81_03745 [Gemmatimonadetes bacterium]|nr:hypothetical protein [Gemmatimonadota bacterium]
MPDDAWYTDIHKRLCEGDLTAFAELAEEVMESLVEKLSRKYPNLRDPDLPTEAVADALMDYSKRPEQFDPTQRGLFGFLVMAAEGDLKNALARSARRRDKEIQLEPVEVDECGGNTIDRTSELDERIDFERIQDSLNELLDDPKDRAVVKLMMEGERATEVFAQVLELEALSEDQQRTEVKKNKDRIKKRLQRHHGDILGHE